MSGISRRDLFVVAAIAVLLVLATLLLAAAPVVGQQRPVYRSTADLVVLHTVVLSDDAPVTDLRAGDFRVTEEGVEREISVFIPPGREPVDMVLAVDRSCGVAPMWPVQESLDLLLDSLPPGSCVQLLPFDETIREGYRARPDDPALRRRVTGLVPDGYAPAGSVIYDALVVAYDRMRERIAGGDVGSMVAGESPLSVAAPAAAPPIDELLRFRREPTVQHDTPPPPPRGECRPLDAAASPSEQAAPRRIVAVLTDGQDRGSRAGVDDAILAAWGSNVPVYALAVYYQHSGGGLGFAGRPSPYPGLRALERLTEYTGGMVFRAEHDPDYEDIWDQLQRLIGSMKAHYVLGYVPDPVPSGAPFVDRREVDVEVRRQGVEVLVQDRVARGAGVLENDALAIALRGLHEIAVGRFEDALGTLDAAAAMAPDLVLAPYGRGIALSALGEPVEALEQLRAAAERAPWLPDLDARLAELLLELGDPDGAWSRALRAHARGSDVGELLERLQELAPRDIDLADPRVGGMARVALTARAAADVTVQGLVLPKLIGDLSAAAWTSSNMVLTGRAGARDDEVDLWLELDLDDIRERGPRIEVRGRLVLRDAAGDELREVRLRLPDLRSEQRRASIMAAAMDEVQVAVDEYLRRHR